MATTISSKELAIAAAQGVAIALSAHKSVPGAAAQLFIPPRFIFGIPTELFEVELQPGADGTLNVAGVKRQ